jgi:hypothetical protein
MENKWKIEKYERKDQRLTKGEGRGRERKHISQTQIRPTRTKRIERKTKITNP